MKKTNEVSKLVGVSRRTLQYYNDEGVLWVERSQNNHRMYDQKALEGIWQILIYKEMGFELREIKQLMEASDKEKNDYFEQKKAEIKNQIMNLKGQMNVISLVQKYGMPLSPTEKEGVTYVDSIVELRKKWKEY